MAWCLTLLMMAAPAAAASHTPAGTVINHSFTVHYGTPSATVGSSNQTGVTVKDLADPAIAPARSAVTPAGQAVDFLHTITNRGNSTDTFRLTASLVQGTTSKTGTAVKMQFFAADGKTLLPTDSTGAQTIGPLAPNASLDLVLKVTPPAASEGTVDVITVTATSTVVASRSSTLKDQLIVPVPGGLAPPVTEVAPTGSVLPGSTLSYSIIVANTGLLDINGVKITDPLNPLLEYQPGSATLPTGLAGGVTYDSPTHSLIYDIPTLPAGYSGSLTFNARVLHDAPAGSSIPNEVTLVSALNPDPVPSNETLTPVFNTGLVVSKQASTTVAEVGDLVGYTVQVENAGTAALTQVTLYDKLPGGFRYLKGSGVVDGLPSAGPTGAGNQLIWDLGRLEIGASRKISYRLAVTGDAHRGMNVNTVTVSGVTAAGGNLVSPPATAAVRVRSSVLSDKAIILGRVFVDRNGNGIPDPGEIGVPGVRVYLEDGSFVFTDQEGQYSFTGVSAGEHVAKIDRSTLLPRYKAVPYNTAFAGVGWSQFITVPFGGPARGDFALADSGEGEAAPAAPAAQVPAPAIAPAPAAPAAPAPAAPAPAAPAPAQPQSQSQSASKVARLRLTPDRIDMPADGKTVVPFTVELFDEHDKRVGGSRMVTVSTSKGTIVEADQDPGLPGHQVLASNGMAVFRVRSGTGAGQDEIVVTGEGGIRARADVFFNQELRDWILVGLGTLTVGNKWVSGNVEKIDKDDRFDEGIFHDERLAFFTRGKILGKYLLTAAYDSGKERRDGVFQTIDPEKYYPVYGDASDIGYEAQSRGKIYLKVEAGRSYLLAGDYKTDLSENEFSRYDRALNGVKVEVNTEHLSAKGFESKTEETLAREEFAGNGTSGYYFLSRKPVFENSERVRIEVRDRYHSERLISVSEKVRYLDYSIDYNTGAILFKEPIPSLDQYLNPVTIVVIYQSQTGGSEHYVYGGRALLKSATGSYFGGTAVVEEGSLKDNTLYGLDAGLKIGERMSLKGEGAVSDTFEKGKGSAWKTELTARPFDSVTVGGYYRKVEADFLNRSMTGNEIGTEKFGGRVDYRGLWDTLIFGESFVQKDEITGTRQFGNQTGFLKKFSLFEGEGGFKRIEEEKAGVEDASNLLYAQIKGPLTKRLEGTLRRDQLLNESTVAEYQSRTFLKLDYRLNDKTNAFVTEEYQEGSPIIRQATRFGVESRLTQKMRIVTGYQLSSGAAGSSQNSSVDLYNTLLDRDGLALESRSGYQLEHALSQERGQAILGLNSRYRAAEGLYLNSTLERVQTVQGITGTRTAFTLASEYLRQKDLKVTSRYEIRTGPEETVSLYQAGAAYKLTGNLTLLGKATFSDRDAGPGHDLLFDGYVGTSYRPLAGHPLQLLTLVRYKLDDNASAGTGENRSLIVSAEPTYRIVKNWSLQGKYAGKINWASTMGYSYQAYTDLFLAGVSYDLAEKWELSTYLKLTDQYDTGYHSLGAVASAGYRVYRNVVLSAGYNYARLDDRDLTGETFQGQGPFFGVKVKFDEDMFERQQAAKRPEPPKPAVAAEEVPAAAPIPPAPPKPPIPVLMVAAERVDEDFRLSGSAELFTLLVNGERTKLPPLVSVTSERLSGSVNLKKGMLSAPVAFTAQVERPGEVRSWSLEIVNGEGAAVRTMKGKGAPGRVAWAGETDGAAIREGEIYQYQLQVTYLDGSVSSTAKELFGVNKEEAVLLTLAGGAFVFDTWNLTAEAKRLLKGAARVLRAHPHEKVIVEGHTDGIGTARYNMELSRKRCESAADFLVREEGIPESRLIRRWYGKSRPIADNSTTPGRRLNRRVELKGNFRDTVPVSPDRYRGRAFVVINDRKIPLDPLGRFETTVPAETHVLKVEMGDSLGRSIATTLPVPALTLAEPLGRKSAPYGGAEGWLSVDVNGAVACKLSGTVDPGSSLEIDGKAIALDQSGRFSTEIAAGTAEQVYGLVLRNPAGCMKMMNLRLQPVPQGPVEGRPQP